MVDKKNIAKMFGVLVLGGSLMVSADTVGANEGENEEEVCQLELHQKEKFIVLGKTKTCLDNVNKELSLKEILQNIEDEKTSNPPDCLTPFCGCWLG